MSRELKRTCQDSAEDVAEHFYELLTHPVLTLAGPVFRTAESGPNAEDMLELHTPILIACNKSDLGSARSEKFIARSLAKPLHVCYMNRLDILLQ